MIYISLSFSFFWSSFWTYIYIYGNEDLHSHYTNFYSQLTCVIEWYTIITYNYNKINMWTWFHWPLILWWHHYHRGHADLLLLHFALLPWGSFEGGLPPSPQVLVLEGHWGLLSPGRLKLHTRGKECGTGTHTQQTEIMQSLSLCTRSPMYDIRTHTLNIYIHYIQYTLKYVCTYVHIHRLMHVTHISSVLVQKVSVFGSSRTSKVFHLTAEEHTDVCIYPRTQPTTSTCTNVHVHTCVDQVKSSTEHCQVLLYIYV